MGPEQKIQRRFLPIGRTGDPLSSAKARAANPTALVNERLVEIWDAPYPNCPAPHVVFRHTRRRRKRQAVHRLRTTKASSVICPERTASESMGLVWMLHGLLRLFRRA